MPRAIPRSSQKRLARLLSARADIIYALDAAERLQNVADDEQRYHLFLSMVVSYARPFTQSRGIGSLLREYPDYPDFSDPELNRIHKRLLQMRHSFFSHSSAEGMKAFIVAPGAKHPVTGQMSDEHDWAVARLHFPHPEYVPWLAKVIAALRDRLARDIRTIVREVGSAYLDRGEIVELDTGTPPFKWNDEP